jgi:hypothetical protein
MSAVGRPWSLPVAVAAVALFFFTAGLIPHPFFFSRHSLERLLRHHALDVERLVRVHAARRLPWLHRQDWIAVARK